MVVVGAGVVAVVDDVDGVAIVDTGVGIVVDIWSGNWSPVEVCAQAPARTVKASNAMATRGRWFIRAW